MPQWHELIEYDKQLNGCIASNMSRIDSGDRYRHPALLALFHELGLTLRRQVQLHSPYDSIGDPYSSYSAPPTHIRTLDANDLDNDYVFKIFDSIGETILMTLLEENPSYVKRLLEHAMGAVMDAELHRLSMREMDKMVRLHADNFDHTLTSMASDTFASMRPALSNEDYEFWWDYSEDGDIIYIMSDWDGTPETGLHEIEFDPDDADERESAVREAEEMVVQLCRDELKLEHLRKKMNKDEPSDEPEVKIRPTMGKKLYPSFLDGG